MAIESTLHAAGPRYRTPWLPMIAAVMLFAAIVYIQFSGALGGNGFFAELGLAIGFYYCYAWAKRMAATDKKANDARGV